MTASREGIEQQLSRLDALADELYKDSRSSLDNEEHQQAIRYGLYSLVETQKTIADIMLEMLKSLQDVRRISK